MYSEKGETVRQVVGQCSKLAHQQYKRKHDELARYIHWELCGKVDLERVEKWYEHKPGEVIENEGYKIL